jgi:hypothetical protein
VWTSRRSRLLAPQADRPLIDLRLAETDFALKKYPVALVALKSAMEKASPALVGGTLLLPECIARVRPRRTITKRGVQEFAKSSADRPFIERALNELGTYYILQDEDEKAAAVFADYYQHYPQGLFADRAAWRAGWWATGTASLTTPSGFFDTAAVLDAARRLSSIVAVLGGAAQLENGSGEAAVAAYRRVIGDYRNSYYGAPRSRRSNSSRPRGGPQAPVRYRRRG